MSERKVIDKSEMPDIIRMPLIKGVYFTHDIGLFVSQGDVHIFEKTYRQVKCGKGTRKLRDSSESVNIPFKILDIFIESLQKLKEKHLK